MQLPSLSHSAVEFRSQYDQWYASTGRQLVFRKITCNRLLTIVENLLLEFFYQALKKLVS
jgi:hypothetical protein